MKNPENRKEWEKTIASYRSSGQTASRWCSENDVGYHALKYWIKKIKKETAIASPEPTWVDIDTSSIKKSVVETSIMIRIGHASIELKSGFNANLLTQVVQTLSSLC